MTKVRSTKAAFKPDSVVPVLSGRMGQHTKKIMVSVEEHPKLPEFPDYKRLLFFARF